MAKVHTDEGVLTQDATSLSTTPEVVSPNVDPTEEDATRIATLNSVLNVPTVVVGAPEEVVPPQVRERMTMAEIRVNEDIESMSYVAGGKAMRFTFKQGHVYRVPIQIAQELERIGKVYH